MSANLKLLALLALCKLFEPIEAGEAPPCPTPACDAAATTSAYTITPKRSCYEPYHGPLLGTIDEAAFDAAPIEATADRTHLVDEGESLLLGNADVKKLSRQIGSPKLTYKRPEEIITAQDGFRYQEPGLVVVGKEATAKLQEHKLTAKDTEYRIEQRHARGSAKELYRDEQKNITLYDATFTTCAPGNRDWLLSANKVFLNPTTGWGEAYSAKMSILSIPVAFLPYYRFPIDNRRHTGFLTPTVGYNKISGIDASIPFYWNLHPQYDLFITPRYLSDRGLQFKNEFRYLNRRGKGNLNVEFLPSDKSFKPPKARGFARYENQTKLNNHWSFDWNLNGVSDATYFTDLDNDFGFKEVTYLPQDANLYYNSEHVNLLTRVQSFQTIDETISKANRPFARLPEMAFSFGRPERFGLDWSLPTLLTRFFRTKSGENTLDKALRFDIAPNLRFPLEAPYGYIEPSFTVKTTHYQLGENSSFTSKSITRTIPLFSVDNRLFLERDLSLFKNPYIQTLEPRLFYVFIPKVEQNHIPNFDSSLPTLYFGQLFRENRFTGQDRIGDANNLSLSLASRFLSVPKLAQRASASVGQMIFLGDREVTLGNEDNTRRFSNVFTEVSYALNDYWSITDTLEWNTSKKNQIDRNTLTFHFQKDTWSMVHIGYNFKADAKPDPASQQIDIGALWPITSKLLGVARFYYDLDKKQTIDTIGGFEYNSCCWALRFVLDRKLTQLNNPDGTLFDHRYYIQFEFKGLGTIGQKADSLLTKNIPGYSPPPVMEFRYGYK